MTDLERLDDRHRGGIEQAAGFGQRDRARGAFEQTAIELRFEFTNDRGKRRLAEMHALRSLREARRIRDAKKNLELLEG